MKTLLRESGCGDVWIDGLRLGCVKDFRTFLSKKFFDSFFGSFSSNSNFRKPLKI